MENWARGEELSKMNTYQKVEELYTRLSKDMHDDYVSVRSQELIIDLARIFKSETGSQPAEKK